MPFTYNGKTWSVHSDVKPWSFGYSTVNPNLVRFEVREGDEWSGDDGRAADYNRSELGGVQDGSIVGGNEVWFSWAMRGWNIQYAYSVFQIYSDQVELQLQSGVGGVAVHTWSGAQGDEEGSHDVRYTDAPIRDGRVERFLLRVKSRNTGDSELQMWRNGIQSCNLSGFSMGVDNPTNQKRPKIGIYRPKRAQTTITHMANFRMGPDLSSQLSYPDTLPSGWAGYLA